MLPYAAAGFAGIYWTQVAQRVNARGWDGYLAVSEDDLFFLRAWLGFEELARTNDDVGEAVRDLWHDVRFWFRCSIGRELTDVESGRLTVLLAGLWDRLASSDPIDADLAQHIWAGAYSALREEQSDGAAA
ncbi:hypothetical protein J2S40_004814 [Nocardioides luteus]|uniref:Uncharacterized protein n=1 Tax=Nocardioides luteus TaxID=1844 RepID=A0ABQ5T3C6_9ACTN|nr:hypothetical protein [Nocardioides luteus]MDR7313756.1 hypothetical protein [Nocardioides luteus]GGR63592.1 hypothetical protein GCM10010197_33620 [Nocardioides luteus]GLJ70395.1 hypothetical protein GCM10017579_44310 [Nocardioides luteus]